MLDRPHRVARFLQRRVHRFELRRSDRDARFELGFQSGDPGPDRRDPGRDRGEPRAVGQEGMHPGRTPELGVDGIEPRRRGAQTLAQSPRAVE